MPALSSSSACLVDATVLPLHSFASNRHRLLPVIPSSFRKTHLHYFTLRTPRVPTVRPSLYASTNPFVEDAEETVLGDCVVFEDGIFDDPFLDKTPRKSLSDKPTRRKKKPIVLEENLVPDKWKGVQDEINLTKKDKRRIAREAEFASRLEKYKKKEGVGFDVERYASYRSEKLSQLRPLVLDEPDYPLKEAGRDGDAERRNEGWDESVSSSGRVAPKNPRLDVSGDSFQEIKKSLESNYEDGLRDSHGSHKLFSKEEKLLLNKRVPSLAEATSSKWIPMHTLAASGQFYLLDMLLKHDVDVNAIDKDGLTALHKAILCKKMAVMNHLLRESANPLVRDKDGATLLHYAVQVASVHAIKILILYNVDVNLSDNYGWTPLHLAVQTRRTDVVRLLLIKGADKSFRNKDGLTPLEMCLYGGRDLRTYELVKLLKLFPKSRSS